MKKFLALAGFLAGVAIGIGLLLVNPIGLLRNQPVPLSGAVRTFTWASTAHQGMPLTAQGLFGFDDPAAAGGFTEPGIRHARAEVVALTGEAGTAPALGIRLSGVPPHNHLAMAQLGIVTAWNIVWPGQGSVALAGSENFWSPLRDATWSAVRGRGLAPAGARYPLPPLHDAGAPLLVGGTGIHAAARGNFREEFSPVSGSGDFSGLRQLHLAIE